jgi:hypothetical protein
LGWHCDALSGDRSVQEIASKHKPQPNEVSTWKRQDGETEVCDLHAKIGYLMAEWGFLAGGLRDGCVSLIIDDLPIPQALDVGQTIRLLVPCTAPLDDIRAEASIRMSTLPGRSTDIGISLRLSLPPNPSSCQAFILTLLFLRGSPHWPQLGPPKG